MTQHEVAKLFGVKSSMKVNQAPEIKGPVPKGDSHYCHRLDQIEAVCAWWNSREKSGLYLYGPTGSGKSSLIKQFAATMGIPVYSVTGHVDMELGELLGQYTLIDGTTVWVDGPLTEAVSNGGIFLFNEVDLVRPGVLTGTNEVRDRGTLILQEKGGEPIPVNENFRFVVTANSSGLTEDTGSYLGVGRMNVAFLDGFTVVEVGYPTKAEEKKIVASTTVMPAAMLKVILPIALKVAEKTRSAFASAEVSAPLTTRGLCRWMDYTIEFFDPSAKNRAVAARQAVMKGLTFAYLGRLPKAERTAIEEVVIAINDGREPEDPDSDAAA